MTTTTQKPRRISPRRIDLTGKRFGRLVVLSLGDRNYRGDLRWNCRCDCGRETVVEGGNLRGGKSKSCGCMIAKALLEASTKHGASYTAEYRIWHGMKYRCADSRNPYYGGRGVRVCERWQNSFEAFLEDMGTRPSSAHSIDRIDPNGNYEPGNCRWATVLQQSNNRRHHRLIDFDGEILTSAEAARRLGEAAKTVQKRARLRAAGSDRPVPVDRLVRRKILSDEQVEEILRRIVAGEKQRTIAADFNVSEAAISHIATGRRSSYRVTAAGGGA